MIIVVILVLSNFCVCVVFACECVNEWMGVGGYIRGWKAYKSRPRGGVDWGMNPCRCCVTVNVDVIVIIAKLGSLGPLSVHSFSINSLSTLPPTIFANLLSTVAVILITSIILSLGKI